MTMPPKMKFAELPPGTELDTHPIAKLFPRLEKNAAKSLRENLAAIGQLQPITLVDNMIVDGVNRYHALRELDMPIRVRYWPGGASLLDFVIGQNSSRRHLSESQRAYIAAGLIAAKVDEGAEPDDEKVANLPAANTGRRRDWAADQMNVSPRMVQAAIKVRRDGTPGLNDAVFTGNLALSLAEQIVDCSPEEQDRLLAAGVEAIRAAVKGRSTKSGSRAAAGTGQRLSDDRAEQPAAIGKSAEQRDENPPDPTVVANATSSNLSSSDDQRAKLTDDDEACDPHPAELANVDNIPSGTDFGNPEQQDAFRASEDVASRDANTADEQFLIDLQHETGIPDSPLFAVDAQAARRALAVLEAELNSIRGTLLARNLSSDQSIVVAELSQTLEHLTCSTWVPCPGCSDRPGADSPCSDCRGRGYLATRVPATTAAPIDNREATPQETPPTVTETPPVRPKRRRADNFPPGSPRALSLASQRS